MTANIHAKVLPGGRRERNKLTTTVSITITRALESKWPNIQYLFKFSTRAEFSGLSHRKQ
jgi:hypothetical protein